MPKKDDKPKFKLQKASQLPQIDYVPTGLPGVDEVVKFPRARITELYGLQGVGKTTLTMMSAAALTSSKHRTLYVDCENSFNPDWSSRLGVNLSYLDIAQTSLLEEVSDVVMDSIPKYDAIIIDSVAAMVPRAEYEGEAGDAVVGLKARLMGQLMRKVNTPLANSKCALIFINQLRESMEMWGAKYTTPGGLALQYAASLRIELKTTAKDKIIKAGREVGHRVHCKITKSKVGRPGQVVSFELINGGQDD